eukprot:1076713-Amphidinium_carterae.1
MVSGFPRSQSYIANCDAEQRLNTRRTTVRSKSYQQSITNETVKLLKSRKKEIQTKSVTEIDV